MTPVTSRLRSAWEGWRGTASASAHPPTQQKAQPRLRPGALSIFPGRNQQPLWTSLDLQSFIDSGFNLNAVIYAACMYRADAVNTARLRAYSGSEEKPKPLTADNPLSALLEVPNPYQSAAEFHALNSVYFSLAGQSFIYFERSKPNAVPTAMYTLRPDQVHIVPGNAADGSAVLGYVFVREGQSIQDGMPLLPENVAHCRRPNPNDPLLGAGYGYSPINAMSQSGNVDNDVTKFLKVFFQSGAMFQNAISFEGEQDENDLAAVRERLKETYGGAENWNEWAVFGSSAKVQRVSPTFDEMGFDAIDARNEARILMALGVPPILVGARLGLERSTYSNYEEARRAFWEDRLLPELRLFESKYKSRLNNGANFIKYDLSDVPALRRDVPTLAKAAYDLWRMGVPARHAFTTTGLDVEEFDGEDKSYVNVSGGGQVQPPTVTPDAEQATDAIEETAESVDEPITPVKPKPTANPPAKARNVKVYDAVDMGHKMDVLSVNWEKRYGDKANELFREEQREISALLTEMQQDAYRRKGSVRWKVLQQTIEDWYSETRPADWRSAFVPLVQGTMVESGSEWSAALGVAWNVRNLQGEAWFQDYMLKFAQPITDTSSQGVHDVLAQAMAEGWSIPETDAHLKTLFDQWMQGDLTSEDFEWFNNRLPPHRRELISRTETLRASNAGALNLGKEWGAKRKFWIGTSDDRIRDSHIAARDTYTEQGAIPIDDTFNVGGNAMNAPGDPSAPVEEVANCRCALGLLMD